MRASLAAALLCTVTSARAVWHAVGVGVQGFTFVPATVEAAVNDALHLIVPDPNVTVIQSAGVDAPCTPLPGGFRSVSGLGKIDLTVFDDSPIYAYAAPHCAEGMVFIVNPRTASDLETMQRNARASAAPTISESNDSAGVTEMSGEHGSTSSTQAATSTPPPLPPVTDSPETSTTPIFTTGSSGSSLYDSDDAQSLAPDPTQNSDASSNQTAEQSEQKTAQRGTSPGLLAPVVVGCVAGTTCVLLLGVFLCRRRRQGTKKALHLESLSPHAELFATPLTLGAAESWNGGWRHERKGETRMEPPPAYMPSES